MGSCRNRNENNEKQKIAYHRCIRVNNNNFEGFA